MIDESAELNKVQGTAIGNPTAEFHKPMGKDGLIPDTSRIAALSRNNPPGTGSPVFVKAAKLAPDLF